MTRLNAFLISGALAFAAASCSKPAEVVQASPNAQAKIGAGQAATLDSVAKLPTLADQRPVDFIGLHNVVAFAPGLFSGSVPEGDKAFKVLKDAGIKTIISVDGAAPDVEAAKAHGLCYVHLPISYNGMSKERTLEIARAVRDLPGPVYLHCHHGKHRSAGAAGAAAVTLGELTPEQATERMKVSGTAPNYTGLYQCVAVAAIASIDELDSASNAFPETWKTSGLVKSMVQIDEVFEHLKLIEKAGWEAPADHPDLVPAAEAGMLADLQRHLEGDERVQAKPPEFVNAMMDGAKLAAELEESLLTDSPDHAAMSAKFKSIGASCKECHAKWRD